MFETLKSFDLDFAVACTHCIYSNSKTNKAQPSNSVKSLHCNSSDFSTLRKFSLLIVTTHIHRQYTVANWCYTAFYKHESVFFNEENRICKKNFEKYWRKTFENFLKLEKCGTLRKSILLNILRKTCYWFPLNQKWNRSGFSRPDWPVNFKIIAGWPVSDRPGRPVFLQKIFVHCSMHQMKNFQKGGMGEVLKFVTLTGVSEKHAKKLLRFLQKWLNFKTIFDQVLIWMTCFEQRKTCTK